MKFAIFVGLVLLFVTLAHAQGGHGGGHGDARKPKAPPKPKEGEKPQKPSNAREGKQGRLEFNLTSVNRELFVWPKGCVFGIRKQNCTRAGENCKPLIFALDNLKELDKCGGKEVGQSPGKNKRKRGASRDALKKLQCSVQSTESCKLPDSSVNAVCVNASAYITDDTYFTFNLYIATQNGTFSYLGQNYTISQGQTKFTLAYSGKTCCAGNDTCTCDDGVTGALDATLRIVGPPGKANKGGYRGQGQGKVSEITAGDAKMEFPTVVDVDGTTVQMEDGDLRVVEDGKDSKISMCIRNVSNYFLYDPIASASSTGESGDSTIAINNEFGDTPSNSASKYPVFTVTGFILSSLFALAMH